jgi:hypothetical protein
MDHLELMEVILPLDQLEEIHQLVKLLVMVEVEVDQDTVVQLVILEMQMEQVAMEVAPVEIQPKVVKVKVWEQIRHLWLSLRVTQEVRLCHMHMARAAEEVLRARVQEGVILVAWPVQAVQVINLL